MPIVLVCQVYIDDNWYGDRHRVILFAEDGVGFKNKTEAKKFTVRLRKYTQKKFSRDSRNVFPITNDNVFCGELDTFVEYTYVSSGPSLSYTHYNISVAELLSSTDE